MNVRQALAETVKSQGIPGQELGAEVERCINERRPGTPRPSIDDIAAIDGEILGVQLARSLVGKGLTIRAAEQYQRLMASALIRGDFYWAAFIALEGGGRIMAADIIGKTHSKAVGVYLDGGFEAEQMADICLLAVRMPSDLSSVSEPVKPDELHQLVKRYQDLLHPRQRGFLSSASIR
ncbi:hypothetical protein J4475_01400 [Candidatus Woesearchaeota archaeon]|nr:hypothetical protein [Candidatus Woesearchaeota archaeon]